MVLALVLGALLLLVLVTNVVQRTTSWSFGAKTGRESGRWLEEVVAENNTSSHKIAIIDVEGIITSMAMGHRNRNMVDLIEDQLKMAARDSSVKAVLLKVDSPGGEVMASDDISRALLDFQERYQKPVVAAIGRLGRLGWILRLSPLPVDRGERVDHDRQHRRDHEHL